MTPEQKQLLQLAAKAFRAGERYLKKGLGALKVVIIRVKHFDNSCGDFISVRT